MLTGADCGTGDSAADDEAVVDGGSECLVSGVGVYERAEDGEYRSEPEVGV